MATGQTAQDAGGKTKETPDHYRLEVIELLDYFNKPPQKRRETVDELLGYFGVTAPAPTTPVAEETTGKGWWDKGSPVGAALHGGVKGVSALTRAATGLDVYSHIIGSMSEAGHPDTWQTQEVILHPDISPEDKARVRQFTPFLSDDPKRIRIGVPKELYLAEQKEGGSRELRERYGYQNEAEAQARGEFQYLDKHGKRDYPWYSSSKTRGTNLLQTKPPPRKGKTKKAGAGEVIYRGRILKALPLEEVVGQKEFKIISRDKESGETKEEVRDVITGELVSAQKYTEAPLAHQKKVPDLAAKALGLKEGISYDDAGVIFREAAKNIGGFDPLPKEGFFAYNPESRLHQVTEALVQLFSYGGLRKLGLGGTYLGGTFFGQGHDDFLNVVDEYNTLAQAHKSGTLPKKYEERWNVLRRDMAEHDHDGDGFINDREKGKAAQIVGVKNLPAAWVEKLGNLFVLNKLKRGTVGLTIGEWGKKRLKEHAQIMVTEVAEEEVEQVWGNLLASEFEGYDSERKITEGMWDTAVVTALTMGLASGGRAGLDLFQGDVGVLLHELEVALEEDRGRNEPKSDDPNAPTLEDLEVRELSDMSRIEHESGGSIRYARTNPEEEETVGIGRAAVEKAIKKLRKKTNANVVVFEDVDEIKDPFVREFVKLQGAAWGFYDKSNTIYLNASKLDSAEKAQQIFRHETFGHLGIELATGRDTKLYHDFYNYVIRKYKGTTRWKDLEDRYGSKGDLVMAREFVANVSESPHSFRNTTVSDLAGRLKEMVGIKVEKGEGELNDELILKSLHLSKRIVETGGAFENRIEFERNKQEQELEFLKSLKDTAVTRGEDPESYDPAITTRAAQLEMLQFAKAAPDGVPEDYEDWEQLSPEQKVSLRRDLEVWREKDSAGLITELTEEQNKQFLEYRRLNQFLSKDDELEADALKAESALDYDEWWNAQYELDQLQKGEEVVGNTDPNREELLAEAKAYWGAEYLEEIGDFPIEEAIYWFAERNHEGQASNLYSVLSTSEFNPSPLSNEPDDAMAQELLAHFEQTFQQKKGEEVDQKRIDALDNLLISHRLHHPETSQRYYVRGGEVDWENADAGFKEAQAKILKAAKLMAKLKRLKQGRDKGFTMKVGDLDPQSELEMTEEYLADLFQNLSVESKAAYSELKKYVRGDVPPPLTNLLKHWTDNPQGMKRDIWKAMHKGGRDKREVMGDIHTAHMRDVELNSPLMQRLMEEYKEMGGELPSFFADGNILWAKAHHGGSSAPYTTGEGFKESAITSGTGGLAQGHGLYFADLAEVARHYRNLSRRGTQTFTIDDIPYDKLVLKRFKSTISDFDIRSKRAAFQQITYQLGIRDVKTGDEAKARAISRVKEEIKRFEGEAYESDALGLKKEADINRKDANEEREVLEALEAFDVNRIKIKKLKDPSAFYEVELAPKAHEYLHWDKPLKEQSAFVKKSIRPLVQQVIDYKNERSKGGTIKMEGVTYPLDPVSVQQYMNRASGSDFYADLSHVLANIGLIGQGATSYANAEQMKAASKALLAAGVKGNRYWDNKSRDKTSRTVLFEGIPVDPPSQLVELLADKELADKVDRDRMIQLEGDESDVRFTDEEQAQIYAIEELFSYLGSHPPQKARHALVKGAKDTIRVEKGRLAEWDRFLTTYRLGEGEGAYLEYDVVADAEYNIKVHKDAIKASQKKVAFINGLDLSKITSKAPKKTHNYVIFDEADVTIKGGETGGVKFDLPDTGLDFALIEGSANDAAHEAAVGRGDMAVAGRLVEAAAKAGGYTVKAGHATPFEFREFDRNKISDADPDTRIRGFFFSTEPSVHATAVTGSRYIDRSGDERLPKTKIIDTYLKLDRTIDRREAEGMVDRQIRDYIKEFGDDGNLPDSIYFPKGYDTVLWEQGMEWTPRKQKKFDQKGEITERGRTFRRDDIHGGVDEYRGNEHITGTDNLKDAYGLHSESVYLIKSPSQIKSAAPATYDESGNLIPLTARFDQRTPNIDFALIEGERKGLRKRGEDYSRFIERVKDNENVPKRIRDRLEGIYKIQSHRELLGRAASYLWEEDRETGELRETPYSDFNTFKKRLGGGGVGEDVIMAAGQMYLWRVTTGVDFLMETGQLSPSDPYNANWKGRKLSTEQKLEEYNAHVVDTYHLIKKWGTTLGRAIKSMDLFSDLHPATMYHFFKNNLSDRQREQLEKKGMAGEVDEVDEKGNKTGRKIKLTPEALVDEIKIIIEESADVAPKTKGMGKVLDKLLRDQIDDRLGVNEIGLWGEYREEISDKVLARLNKIFGGVDTKDKGDPNLPPTVDALISTLKEVVNDLAPTEPEAKAIVKQNNVKFLRDMLVNSSEFQQVWQTFGERLVGRYKDNPEVLGMIQGVFGKITYDRVTDKVIMGVAVDSLNDMEKKLSNLIKEHSSKRNATIEELAAGVMAELGIPDKAEATKIANQLKGHYKRLVEEAMRKELQRRAKAAGKNGKLRAAYVNPFKRMLQLINMGALDDADIYNALAGGMGLPQAYDEKFAKHIKNLADKVQTAPEGFQRQKAQQELMNAIQGKAGDSLWDLALEIRRAGLLTGFSTQEVNLFGTATSWFSNINNQLYALRGNPRSFVNMWANTLRVMFTDARREFVNILDTGYGRKGYEQGKFQADSIIERWKGFMPLTVYKYAYRALAAVDILFRMSAAEAKWQVLATQAAQGDKAKMKQILQPISIEDAKTQAKKEGLKGRDFKRRVHEIIMQARADANPEMSEEADYFGASVTFQQKPEGVLGWAAQGWNKLAHPPREAGGKPLSTTAKIGKAGFNIFVPFVNTLANVSNAMIEWSPFGYHAGKLGLLKDKANFTEARLADMRYRTYTGFAVWAAVMAKFLDDDEEDDGLDVTAYGNPDPDKRRVEEEGGWRPYTLTIGDKQINYKETIWGAPLVIAGTLKDMKKYGGGDNMDHLFPAAMALVQMTFEQSFLTGAHDFLDMIYERNRNVQQKRLERFAWELPMRFVIPNLAYQIDRWTDPTRTGRNHLTNSWIEAFPFVRRRNSPDLGVFGEPIERTKGSLVEDFFDRIEKSTEHDPMIELMVEKGYVPEPFSKTIKLDSRFVLKDDDEANARYYIQNVGGKRFRSLLDRELESLKREDPEGFKKEVKNLRTEALEYAKRQLKGVPIQRIKDHNNKVGR